MSDDLNMAGVRRMAKLIVTLALGMIGVAGSAAQPEATLPPDVCARKLQNIAAEARAIAEMMDRETTYSAANGGRLAPDSVKEYVPWYKIGREECGEKGVR